MSSEATSSTLQWLVPADVAEQKKRKGEKKVEKEDQKRFRCQVDPKSGSGTCKANKIPKEAATDSEHRSRSLNYGWSYTPLARRPIGILCNTWVVAKTRGARWSLRRPSAKLEWACGLSSVGGTVWCLGTLVPFASKELSAVVTLTKLSSWLLSSVCVVNYVKLPS